MFLKAHEFKVIYKEVLSFSDGEDKIQWGFGKKDYVLKTIKRLDKLLKRDEKKVSALTKDVFEQIIRDSRLVNKSDKVKSGLFDKIRYDLKTVSEDLMKYMTDLENAISVLILFLEGNKRTGKYPKHDDSEYYRVYMEELRSSLYLFFEHWLEFVRHFDTIEHEVNYAFSQYVEDLEKRLVLFKDEIASWKEVKESLHEFMF